MFQYSPFAGRIAHWMSDEAGEATVDWTVLIAGLVGLSLAVMLSLGGGVEQLAEKTDGELSARETSTY